MVSRGRPKNILVLLAGASVALLILLLLPSQLYFSFNGFSEEGVEGPEPVEQATSSQETALEEVVVEPVLRLYDIYVYDFTVVDGELRILYSENASSTLIKLASYDLDTGRRIWSKAIYDGRVRDAEIDRDKIYLLARLDEAEIPKTNLVVLGHDGSVIKVVSVSYIHSMLSSRNYLYLMHRDGVDVYSKDGLEHLYTYLFRDAYIKHHTLNLKLDSLILHMVHRDGYEFIQLLGRYNTTFIIPDDVVIPRFVDEAYLAVVMESGEYYRIIVYDVISREELGRYSFNRYALYPSVSYIGNRNTPLTVVPHHISLSGGWILAWVGLSTEQGYLALIHRDGWVRSINSVFDGEPFLIYIVFRMGGKLVYLGFSQDRAMVGVADRESPLDIGIVYVTRQVVLRDWVWIDVYDGIGLFTSSSQDYIEFIRFRLERL